MDAIPEKFHYLPLPQLPRLDVRDLPRLRMPNLPRLRLPNLPLAAAMWDRVGGRHSGHRVAEIRLDAIPEKFYYVPLPQLPRLHVSDLPLSATIGRGLRGRHRSSRRLVETWRSHTPDARVIERWWVSHTLETVVWMLGMSLAVLVGIVVARL